MSNHLLKLCEELFEKISDNELGANKGARCAIDNLCDELADQSDGSQSTDDLTLLQETQEELREIWDLIGQEEKSKNKAFTRQFDELHEHLSYLIEEEEFGMEDSSPLYDPEEIFDDGWTEEDKYYEESFERYRDEDCDYYGEQEDT